MLRLVTKARKLARDLTWFDICNAIVVIPFAITLLSFILISDLRHWSLNDQITWDNWIGGLSGIAYLMLGVAGFAMWQRLPDNRRTYLFALTSYGVGQWPMLLAIGHEPGSIAFERYLAVRTPSIALSGLFVVAMMVYLYRTRSHRAFAVSKTR